MTTAITAAANAPRGPADLWCMAEAAALGGPPLRQSAGSEYTLGGLVLATGRAGSRVSAATAVPVGEDHGDAGGAARCGLHRPGQAGAP